MVRPTKEIRKRLRFNLTEAREAWMFKDFDRCWSLLEDAHVLSQPWAWRHVRVHGSMFVAAIVQRDVREVRGQQGDTEVSDRQETAQSPCAKADFGASQAD